MNDQLTQHTVPRLIVVRAPYLPALTGLRGVGAVWVTIFHVFNSDNLPIIKYGYFGVDLFFILSGYIISHVHAAEFECYSWKTHVRFLQLRLARIYPLHVFVLGCLAVVVAVLPHFTARYPQPERFDFPHFLMSLFLVQNWGVGPPPLWNTPSWSLSAEWLAYLFFPAISIGCTRLVPNRLTPVAAFLALIIMVALIQQKADGNFGGMGKIGLLRVACEFTTGCLLYRGSLTPGVAGIPWDGLAPALFAGLIAVLLNDDYAWLCLFGLPLLVLGGASRSRVFAAVLANRPARVLGDLSFSMYICHWPVIQVQNWFVTHQYIKPTPALAATTTAIALTSVLTWRFVEIPGRKLGRSLLASPVAPRPGP